MVLGESRGATGHCRPYSSRAFDVGGFYSVYVLDVYAVLSESDLRTMDAATILDLFISCLLPDVGVVGAFVEWSH